MTAYEGVLSCYLFAMKAFNSSFAEIDAMDLDVLLDLISVQEKLSDSGKSDKKIRTYKVLD